jgi:hypothetical protein
LQFYYPASAVLFLDLGLGATQCTLLDFACAPAIVSSYPLSGELEIAKTFSVGAM